MPTARIPPVDPTPATIAAVLATHAGHIFPRFLSLLRISGVKGYVARKNFLLYVFRQPTLWKGALQGYGLSGDSHVRELAISVQENRGVYPRKRETSAG